MKEGFDGYLEKPIRYKKFLASAAAMLEEKPNSASGLALERQCKT